jgi:pyruvate kinase
MPFPISKTKIVCTIGPASETPGIMKQMIRTGMDVGRLNFSHGDVTSHARVIGNLRTAAKTAGRRIAIMADLPGPKMRIGRFAREPIDLKPNDLFILTTEDIEGNADRVSVTFSRLPQVVKPGDTLFLNDGLIQVEVATVGRKEVRCRVRVGGELRSRKGLNLPGIDLGIGAFTENDHQWLRFAMEQGVDVISQSFVEKGADIEAVRSAAAKMGHSPYLFAKIERSRALDHIDEIMEAADGIMIARGDLGVEIPIEQIALVQKKLMRQANLLGKPVITATQMLESMISNRRPTRAEATDVANAILDGTDAVMLSGESAMGSYPVESVAMLAKIAAAIEPHRSAYAIRETLRETEKVGIPNLPDLIARSVETTLEHARAAAVFVRTRSGYTARSISRFRLPVWIIAVSTQETTCQRLQFTYGVYPERQLEYPENWNEFVRDWVQAHGVRGNLIILSEGPSSKHPEANNRMEIIDLRRRWQGKGYAKRPKKKKKEKRAP